MTWILSAVLAYFLLALVALVDKHLVSGPIPGPKVYSFYVGLLGVFSLILVPFGFSVSEPLSVIYLSVFAGAVFVFALFALFSALERFEVSRVVPAIGAASPLFILLFGYLFSGIKPDLNFLKILALVLLICGGVLITLENKKTITIESIKISVLAAFLFALSLTLSKFVYFLQPFWSGFIWMRIGGVLAALFFLFSKEVREELFRKRVSFKPGTLWLFIGNQAIGGCAFILQNFAIALVPLSLLPFVNALEGVKYVFLLMLVFLISLKFPKFLKEKFSGEAMIQKLLAVFLIVCGLVILTLSR